VLKLGIRHTKKFERQKESGGNGRRCVVCYQRSIWERRGGEVIVICNVCVFVGELEVRSDVACDLSSESEEE